jgi:hypothetical protein
MQSLGVPKTQTLWRSVTLITPLKPWNSYATQHQISGVVFRVVFERLYNHFFQENYLDEPLLRRAFLRGIFAAEGCIAIEHQEVFIDHLSISMSIKEENMINLIRRLLKHECIQSVKTARIEQNSLELTIYNWTNYLKAWQIRLFDRCERKRRSFVTIARQSKVYGYLREEDLRDIGRRFQQKEIAALIGSWQSNVSRTLKGEHLMTLQQIRILENQGLHLPVQHLRIGCLTDLPYSEETRRLFMGEC